MKQATLAIIILLFAVSASTRTRRTYTTNFHLSETPISERGNWENGKAVGLDWADIAAIPGHAFGLESGTHGYDDSTALPTADWEPRRRGCSVDNEVTDTW